MSTTLAPATTAPKGIRFHSGQRRQDMVLVDDPKNIWHGWLMFQAADGHWAPLRLAEPEDHAELTAAIVKSHHQ